MPFWRKPAVAGITMRTPDTFREVVFVWFPPVVWSGAILVMAGDLGSAPQTSQLLAWLREYLPWLKSVPPWWINYWLRTAGHFLAYAGLLAVWLRACWKQWPWRDLSGVALALGLTLSVSLLDEGRQWLTPSRSGSLNDVLLDMSGALSMALTLMLLRLRRL